MHLTSTIRPSELAEALERFWALSGAKLDRLSDRTGPAGGALVFTAGGRYTSRGWTEWTEGFHFGSAFLQYDATAAERFADFGRRQTLGRMAVHVSHVGVHDHGFNNLSTYGNWLRLQREGRLPGDHLDTCELALKVSGAIQASRWSPIHGGGGFMYSFNGPHSLFVDTIRSCRVLMVAHGLGHRLMGENDTPHSLLGRALDHLAATARYSVYYGEGRDRYDDPGARGRTAHESIFNPNDGRYRCPNSQQGYSGFTTWTRGLAWAMLGFAEELEFLASAEGARLAPLPDRPQWTELLLKAARATCDWYLAHTAADGIPYWDGGAPDLPRLGAWRDRPAEPFNDHEPVDSSAAAIGAQGLLRLGRVLGADGAGAPYWQAGLQVMRTLLAPPYLATEPGHDGLLLHSVYHRPNGWDHLPPGRRVPCGEAGMWGDYHLREAALYLSRIIAGGRYLTFYGCLP